MSNETRITPTTEDPTPSGPLNDVASGKEAPHADEKRSVTIRPVKVRLGEGHVKERPGGPNGDGGNGHEARATSHLTATLDAQRTTPHLRDTDLTGLRLKLKREEWAYTRGLPVRNRLHKRPLPYFLMRHRQTRARSRAGYTRSQVARRRFGGGGPAVVALRLFLALAVLTAMAGGAGMGAAAAGVWWYIEDKLPPVGRLDQGLNVQTTKIYDRNGIPLFDVVDEGTGRRSYVPLGQISPLVISATLATEDATFYTNPGVEPVAIVRALYINVGGKGQSGASTITQQVVRHVNLTDEEQTQQTFSRKVREAIQAVRFTREYSKDYILELYLNEIPYGNRAYGIEAAALTYFDKSAKDLNLAEAALLAGLPQRPSYYDPFVSPDEAKARQAHVLELMVKQGMISEQEGDAAKIETLVLRPHKPELLAPHFVYYVKDYLEQIYGPQANVAGLIVTTTLDLRVQAAAEKVARDRIGELKRQKATNAAIVIMKPGTGEILAMVGSVDYENEAIDGQVNVATRERQPGSSFKPITYATAFKKGWTPATVINDTLTAFPNPGQKPYTPKNYDGRDHGWVTVRESLGNSYNIPAVKGVQFAGVQEVIDTAHDMGIKGLNRGTGWYGLSLTLGGGEVTLLDITNAYSTFANGGVEVDANPILKIEDPQGRMIYCNGAYVTPNDSCSSVRQKPFAEGKGQVLDPRHAYMITSILSDNRARSAAFGPNSPLRASFPAAAKTGTTDDNRDSWTLGYTPNLTVGVWVGNSNNDEMLKVTGAIGAAVVWHNMMEAFYDTEEFVDLVREPDGKLKDKFVQPPGLVKMSACSNKGAVNDLFLKEEPPDGCVNYKDPKTNKQLRSLASPTPKPQSNPTPLPGIWPPLEP